MNGMYLNMYPTRNMIKVKNSAMNPLAVILDGKIYWTGIFIILCEINRGYK